MGAAGAKGVAHARIQVRGGYQNAFVFAERGARTAALWDGLAQRRVLPVTKGDDSSVMREL